MLGYSTSQSATALLPQTPGYSKRSANQAEPLNPTCHVTSRTPTISKMRLRIVSSPYAMHMASKLIFTPRSQRPARDNSSEASPLSSSEDSPQEVAIGSNWPGRSLELDSDNSSPTTVGVDAISNAGLNRDPSVSSICVSDGDDGGLSSLPPRSPEADARLQELLSDPCIISLSETGVQCALCKKWYKVGTEWKHTYVWKRHKRVCPVKKQRSVLGRPPHIPVEIVRHIVDEGHNGDGSHGSDPRIRDSTYFDFQCDLCCRWIKKAHWESHIATPCNRPRTAKGWVYLDDNFEAEPSNRKSISTPHSAPAPPLAPPASSLSEADAALRVRLPPATKQPRIVGFFDEVSDDEDEVVDYADLYSRYIIPGPAPKYSFRHAATPTSTKRLRPAVFAADSDDEEDEQDAAARRARDVEQFDVNVLMEGTTSIFLRPRGRPKCYLDAPAGAAPAEQARCFPETVGMSVRQLMQAGLQPLTF